MAPSATPLWEAPTVQVPISNKDRTFPVRRVYCVGRNYVAHIREMKEGNERDAPFFFQKPTDAVVASGTAIPFPQHTQDFQYEGELVVAIGRGGINIPSEKVGEHIFGYAAGLDMTRRDRQKEALNAGRPWEAGKSFDHSAPCAPITAIEECPAIGEGTLCLSVNGQQRQKSDLDLMIWDVAEIIEKLSRQYRLEGGDLIYTGTPAGVGAVRPGDVIRLEITGLKELEVSVT